MTRTIIITGASSGIGYALAEHLASLGHAVIATGRNKESLSQLQQLHPNQISTVIADLNTTDDLSKIQRALSHNQTEIHLIHNAGIAKPALLENMTENEWDEHATVNLKSPLFLTKLLLPNLKNGGRVLNISTGVAHRPLIGFPAYGITKAAFFNFKEYGNTEFNKYDISFGSAMPGIVDTPIQEHLRDYPADQFPAVELFRGFKQRDELLSPNTAAKFLAWLLLNTTKDQFVKGDWDIYDSSHHQFWATQGEVKDRNMKSS